MEDEKLVLETVDFEELSSLASNSRSFDQNKCQLKTQKYFAMKLGVGVSDYDDVIMEIYL